MGVILQIGKFWMKYLTDKIVTTIRRSEGMNDFILSVEEITSLKMRGGHIRDGPKVSRLTCISENM